METGNKILIGTVEGLVESYIGDVLSKASGLEVVCQRFTVDDAGGSEGLLTVKRDSGEAYSFWVDLTGKVSRVVKEIKEWQVF